MIDRVTDYAKKVVAGEIITGELHKLACQRHLDNLESYLSNHFSEWLDKYANTPEGITSELKEFSNMIL